SCVARTLRATSSTKCWQGWFQLARSNWIMSSTDGIPRSLRIKVQTVPLPERQNLTMRMSMRRFTRLTNAFSKKLQNHEAAIALHFMHYNFARIHQSLPITRAMAAGISDRVWSLEEIVGLL